MAGQATGHEALIPLPGFSLPEIREAVAKVAPGRLPEMFAKMQDAFTKAGEQNSVIPIHMFCREWAVVVEIERHPDIARWLHDAEQALMSDDPGAREAAIATAGDIVRAAHRVVDDALKPTIVFGLGDQIHALFEGLGGDFESPERRQDLPRAAEFMT